MSGPSTQSGRAADPFAPRRRGAAGTLNPRPGVAPTMDLDMTDDAALVTGSTRGLGRETALSLAREGADIVVNGRDPDRLAAAVEAVGDAGGGEVIGVEADLTVRADVEDLVAETTAALGGLDRLVVCGGGPPPKELLNTEDEDFYAAFDLLVMSVARLVRNAAPHLRDGGGSVVVVSSIGVKEPLDWHVLTSAVRVGAVGMAKSLSAELAPAVRVNSVLPGPHETERFRELHEGLVAEGSFDSYEAAVADTTADVPLDRVGTPEEFADTVAFLCSPRSGNVTGVALPVDGGSQDALF